MSNSGIGIWSSALLDKIARLVTREQLNALNESARAHPQVRFRLMKTTHVSGTTTRPQARAIIDAFIEAGVEMSEVKRILADAGVDDVDAIFARAQSERMTSRSIAYRQPIEEESAPPSSAGDLSSVISASAAGGSSHTSFSYDDASQSVREIPSRGNEDLITIRAEPVACSCLLGGTASFYVDATCISPYRVSYQWFRGKRHVREEKGPRLVITNVSVQNRAQYTCRLGISELKHYIFTNWCELIISNPPDGSYSHAAEAPVIVKQPRSKTVCIGSTITLSTNADGCPPPAYQWYKNGVLMQGSVQRDLELKNVAQTDVGSYCCAVSNQHGGSFSNTAVIQVIDQVTDAHTSSQSPLPSTPLIQLHPQSKQIYEGSSLRLECRAICAYPIQYEWYKSGRILASKRGPLLNIGFVNATHAGQYSCRTFTTEGMDSLSQLATVTVLVKPSAPPPTPDSEDLSLVPCVKPMEQTTRPGGSVTFICYASIPRDTPRPGDVVLHFQWLRSGEAITPLSPKQNVLTLENVSLQDDGATFVCCVSDGKKMTQSMPARLTVTTKSGGKESRLDYQSFGSVTSPRIVEHPRSFQGDSGSRTTLRCHAVCPGGEPLSYQWIVKDVLGMDKVPDATESNFEITVSAYNAFTYACRVTNRHGNSSESNPAKIIVNGSLGHVSQSGNVTSYLSTLSLSPTDTSSSSSTSSSSISRLHTTTNGSSASTATSSSQQLNIETIIFEKQPESIDVRLGEPLKLEASAIGLPDLIFCWFHNGKPIFSAGEPTYYKPSTTPKDAGSYYCVARNDYNSAKSAEIYVGIRDVDTESANSRSSVSTSPLHFVKQPQGADLWVGDQLRLEVIVVGSPEPDYVWVKDGRWVSHGNQAVYVKSRVTPDDAGIYHCLARNAEGSIESEEVMVKIRDPSIVRRRREREREEGPSAAESASESDHHGYPRFPQSVPTFTRQPQATVVCVGDVLRLEAYATGMPYPQHFWYHEGRSLLRGSGSVYVKKAVTIDDAGFYFCKAINAAGETVSNEIAVKVRV